VNAASCAPSRRALPRRLWAGAALAAAFALLSNVQPVAPPQRGADALVTTQVAHADAQRAREIRERFEQGVLMLHAKRYDEAATALQRVLVLAPHLPEAHVNLGFAWLGLQQPQQAERAFQTAIGIRADQANAYYGLAMALEQRNDLEPALGAMRSYLHLSRGDDAHRARARAALWEWEERMGRHRLKGAPSPALAASAR
jgi:tetratricopeptide (TPR) repeat protein